MAYTLAAALKLSSCDKAQTRRGETLFIVCEYPGVVSNDYQPEQEYTSELAFIEEDGTLRTDGPARHYRDFLAELERRRLDKNAPIWHPIGYTPIPEEPADE